MEKLINVALVLLAATDVLVVWLCFMAFRKYASEPATRVACILMIITALHSLFECIMRL